MTRILLRKTAQDAQWLLLACAAMLFAFSWIRVAIVASMELYQFQRLARNLPDMVKRLSPVPLEELISYAGLIGFTYEEPIAYLIMAVWAIARGSDCVSGELGRGTLEMLLAQPVSRQRYLATHVGVTLAGVAVIALAAQAGTHLGIRTTSVKKPAAAIPWTVSMVDGKPKLTPTEPEVQYQPMREVIAPHVFWTATLNYACLGVFLTGLSVANSAWDRNRGRTIGIVVGIYVIATILELSGMAIEGYRWLLFLTFFSVYEPVKFATIAGEPGGSGWTFWAPQSTGMLPDLGPLGCDLVLLLGGLLGIAVAARIFNRRDLPAPL